MILFRKLWNEGVHVFCRFNSSLKPKQVDYCVFLYFRIWTVNRCRWKSGVFSQPLKSKVFFSLSPSWMWWQPCPTAASCSPPHCAVCIFSCSASCDVDGGKTHNNKALIYSILSLSPCHLFLSPASLLLLLAFHLHQAFSEKEPVRGFTGCDGARTQPCSSRSQKNWTNFISKSRADRRTLVWRNLPGFMTVTFFRLHCF